MFVYDLEIIKAIPPKEGILEQGIEYCAGWHDHANMGVSVIGGYDFGDDRYRVFTKDNWGEFANLYRDSKKIFAGFNSIPFDNSVLKACGIVDIAEDRCFDLLREVWKAAGLGPTFEYPSHAGYSLDAVAKANGVGQKTGHGAIAPVDWQRGNIGTVIDYCLQDVALTKKLIDKINEEGGLMDPKTGKGLEIAINA